MKIRLGITLLFCGGIISAQNSLPATDITAATVPEFLKALPRRAVSDRPIRLVDVGAYRVGIYDDTLEVS